MSNDRRLSYKLSKLTKVFPGVVAVNNADMEVRNGEIHGVIGKNGAGKSVLMSMIAGIQRPTSGEIIIRDTPVDIHTYNPAKAHELGVVLIPQEPTFAPHMSVVDNIFIGAPVKNRFGWLDHASMEKQVKEIAERLSVKVSPNDKMSELLLEDQQLLAFGKAIFVSKAKAILLDEITASLPRERKILLLNLLREVIKEDHQISFTLITHQINEVVEFCDRVTVLRDGKAITTLNVSDTNNRELAAFIVGDTVNQPNGNHYHPITTTSGSENRTPAGDAILRVEGLTQRGKYSNVNFKLIKGQVVGLAGLDGSGKHEFLEGLTGLSPVDSGNIWIADREVKIPSPVEALNKGVAYLPKKREEQAIIHNCSVQDNILISIYHRISSRIGRIHSGKSRDIAIRGIKALNVKTPSLKTNIDYLSGGNRQKVVLNRIDNTKPLIYVLNEPTRGVDIATKPEILNTMRTRFTVDSGVIFTSESEEELIDASDVIFVFYKGEIRKTFCRNQPDFTVSEVYKAVQGVGLE